MTTSRPRRRDDLVEVALDGELVLFDRTTAKLHHLSPSAAVVYDLCDGSRTRDEVVQLAARRHGVPATSVAEDVVALIAQLDAAGLTVGAG